MIKKILSYIKKKPLTIALIVLLVISLLLQIKLWNNQKIIKSNQVVIARTLSVATNVLHIPQRDAEGVPRVDKNGNELNIPIGLAVESVYNLQRDILKVICPDYPEICKHYEEQETEISD